MPAVDVEQVTQSYLFQVQGLADVEVAKVVPPGQRIVPEQLTVEFVTSYIDAGAVVDVYVLSKSAATA